MSRKLGPLLIASALATILAAPAHASALDAAQRNGFTRKAPVRVERVAIPQAPIARERRSESAPRRQAVRDAPKIAAPTYYDYKAAALVPVDFAKLTGGAAFEQGDARAAPVARPEFAGLDGFALQAEKRVADAIVAYYAANPDLLWIDAEGRPNARAQEAIAVMGEAASHGLQASDYAVAMPLGGGDEAARHAEAIRFEMALSARALRYLSDATGGRIDPNRLSGFHDFALKPFDGAADLARLGRAKSVRAALESAHPQIPQYTKLREALASVRAETGVSVAVDRTMMLKPGGTHVGLPAFLTLLEGSLPAEALEERAAVLANGANETYGPDLVAAVKRVQEAKGLRGDGIIGPRTIQALTGVSSADREEKLVVALEQVRWLPRTLGETRVFINQPAFTASYVENGVEKLNMRTVIGTKDNQTTFFQDEIERVEYNPYWGVPQSIIVNEMLPRLRSDPGYLDRAGYEVTDASGKRIPSSSVNWGSYGSKIPYGVRQAPSEANALGELKIMFPNKHAIYMHDTPAKSLFSRDSRAFSHGCVRLAQPREMAAAVLGSTVEHVEGKLKGGKHSVEKVSRKIPVYVAYFTAWPDASGTIQYFGDVYERDKHLGEAFASTEQVRAAGS
ncbi:MAG: hypothetical protein DI629_11895 [Mesorhizobium amorphae]|nr:MAG: hypothetical protein DI629_11895 [Mesorhizobium amorphae]